MKKIILLTLLLSSFSLWAQSAYNVCEKLMFDDDKLQCMKILKQGIVNDNVSVLCGELMFDDNKMKCLESALNKRYDDVEVNFCAKLTFDDDQLKCVADGGRPIRIGGTRKLRQIERLALQAQKNLMDGNISLAFDKLAIIIDLATTQTR